MHFLHIIWQKSVALTAFNWDLDCCHKGSMSSSTSGALSLDMEGQHHQKHQEALLWTRTAAVVHARVEGSTARGNMRAPTNERAYACTHGCVHV
eukprot:1161596-Pelagomonas_calceolata.AAC.16